VHIPYQTGNKIKKKTHFFKSLPANELQRANYFLAFLACGILPHRDFQPWRFATGRLGRFAPPSQVDISQRFTIRDSVAFCPTGGVAFCPAEALCPSGFCSFYFFGTIWHDLAHFWHAFFTFGTL
jgi:hypothetical protein